VLHRAIHLRLSHCSIWLMNWTCLKPFTLQGSL
jgi:hypothetical protein